MIRLETSKRSGIENIQFFEVSSCERNWALDIPKRFPKVIPRTNMSAVYNCHGLTFASRRTRIVDDAAINRILSDDKWTEIDILKVLPGDIVLYFSDEGDPNHSGLIVEADPLGVHRICSKWGSAGEYIHFLNDCPSMYGPIKRFFRCQL